MDFSKRTRVVIGASVLLLSASVALADDPVPFPECKGQPTADDVEAAKQSHTIATSRFNLQDWDKAIEFWRQAYGLDCTAHVLLVNIANAYEKKGDKRNAIAALELYLTRATGAPDLVKINERVVELKKSLEPAPPVTATATATAVTPTATATAPPTAAPEGPRPFGVTPLVVAGIGGAIAIAGAIMTPVGLGMYNDALGQCQEKQGNDLGCGGDTALADKGNTGRTLWNAGGVFLGVGLAAAAGGLGWHFLFNKPKAVAAASPSPSPKARIHVVPVASPEAAGLIVTGKF